MKSLVAPHLVLVLLFCACGGPATVAPRASPSSAAVHEPSAEHREMIAAIDLFLRDPTAGDLKRITAFVRESPDVIVVYEQRLIPIGTDLPDGTDTLLLAGFAAGSARSQLASGVTKASPVEGVRGMLAIYSFLRSKNPAVSSVMLEELAAREANGTLDAAVAERLAAPTGATGATGDAAAAFVRLVTTDTFADDAVGYAGETSDNVVAFRVLLFGRSAGDAFARLVREAGPAGKLYGLAGLWHTDHNAFVREATRLAHSTERVKVQFGCSGLELPVARLVDGGSAAIRLRDGETLRQAIEARGSGERDMVGGGFPATFAGDE